MPATRLSLVDLDDVGEVAAIVLTQDRHGGATYELVGTPALSQREVASLLATALGRDVRAEDVPLAAWQVRARAAGIGEYGSATLSAMFRYYAEHGLIGNPNTLHWLLGRAPTSLEVFLKRQQAKSYAALWQRQQRRRRRQHGDCRRRERPMYADQAAQKPDQTPLKARNPNWPWRTGR